MPCTAPSMIVSERTFSNLGVEIKYVTGRCHDYKTEMVQIEFAEGESERDFKNRRDAELTAAIQTTFDELGG